MPCGRAHQAPRCDPAARRAHAAPCPWLSSWPHVNLNRLSGMPLRLSIISLQSTSSATIPRPTFIAWACRVTTTRSTSTCRSRMDGTVTATRRMTGGPDGQAPSVCAQQANNTLESRHARP
eukprot:scaffold45313_cov32-Tisochrysis_lutea.AAC.2